MNAKNGSLAELALDLRWSWNHASDQLWQQLDPELWQLTHNPWLVLQTVSHARLQQKLADPAFTGKIEELIKLKETRASNPAWFQQNHPVTQLTGIAYFSMEFMLSEALPIYVGGLGNVAADQLKAASDLGVPVVAVGLLYQQGYFRQEIDKDGLQKAIFPYNDPGQLPVTPLLLPDGEWLRLKIVLSGLPVWLRTWQVQVGRVKLYLLDSNDAVNLPAHRGITSEIYGGGTELRIQQEILLGIGGFKLLAALGIKPEVCHMNEGHAAFLILERANLFMKETGMPFEAALAVTRAGNLFTTHTAVAAGFDHFNPSLMWEFFESYARDELKIDFNELMALGRQDPNNLSESFNMAYLAIRGSGAVNGVSRLHGSVSRHLFENIFPNWPVAEVPVGSVTNGVHMPSWDSELADEIWTQSCGKGRWRGDLKALTQNITSVTDETFWKLRTVCRNNLVNYTRQKLKAQWIVSGQPPEIIEMAKHVFNPHTLTLGFARRFVAYKRPDLLLHDEDRFIRILTNPERPVQLVIAGKAPPFDEPGKDLIRHWVQFIQEHKLYSHVAFLSDYDMLLAGHLVQGTDVWLNTPRRPWEACGTSGMKVLVNGGINLSELDGWWAEAYTPDVGWALGDMLEHDDDPSWDATEAGALYDLLEQQVVPEFYTRNQYGLPERWIQRMRKSMATLTPQFSANRTVREYTENYYIPAASNYKQRADENGAGLQIINWKHSIRSKWAGICFEEMNVESGEEHHVFRVSVVLNGLKPEEVSVELYADGIPGMAPVRVAMQINTPSEAAPEKCIYTAKVSSSRPKTDFTPRIIPRYEGVAVPLEINQILWQH